MERDDPDCAPLEHVADDVLDAAALDPDLRAQMREELLDHLLTDVERQRACGTPAGDAAQRALAQFGDPRHVAWRFRVATLRTDVRRAATFPWWLNGFIGVDLLWRLIYAAVELGFAVPDASRRVWFMTAAAVFWGATYWCSIVAMRTGYFMVRRGRAFGAGATWVVSGAATWVAGALMLAAFAPGFTQLPVALSLGMPLRSILWTMQGCAVAIIAMCVATEGIRAAAHRTRRVRRG